MKQIQNICIMQLLGFNAKWSFMSFNAWERNEAAWVKVGVTVLEGVWEIRRKRLAECNSSKLKGGKLVKN